jgi:4-hydroxybenzoate polyprenyltransferase
MACTAGCAYISALRIEFARPVLVLLVILYCAAVGAGFYFLRGAVPKRGKLIETMAGVWSLLMYLSLGFVPMIVRQWNIG